MFPSDKLYLQLDDIWILAGGLIGIATPSQDGLMSKNESSITLRKNNGEKINILIETKNQGEIFAGILNLSGVNGDTATLIIAANRWNETRIFATKINGTVSGVKLGYNIDSSKKGNIYIYGDSYISIDLKPIIPSVSLTISKVNILPDDVINIDL